MNPTRRRRLLFVALLVLASGVATALVAMALQRNVAYLYTPAEVLRSSIAGPVVTGAIFVALALLLPLPIWAVIVLQLLYFLSTARIMPHTSALALAAHGREAGAASALMGALQSLVATFAGVAVAIFNDGTLGTLASLMLGSATCGLACYAWVRGVERRRAAA